MCAASTPIYEQIGQGYARFRQPDPRIATQIRAALGDDGPVLNVGAGAGSYEPHDLPVVAVEPSAVMLRQRLHDAAPVVQAFAESLPFVSGSFGAGLGIFTVHHWSDVAGGLAEFRRVARGPIVVLTWEPQRGDEFWLVDEYIPATRTLDRALPTPAEILEALGGGRVETVPVPADCTDGFYAAWWRRPEAYLDPAVRAAISGIARLDAASVEPGIDRLRADLESGEWAARHADLLALESYDAGYRLVIAT